ncbi:hypothetical protein [Nitrosococcus wardiae]|uniref:hypothetical protein n=1 Tax=Nitrosococcus wardiae TaxID=1814290 RepID=UPI001982241F|nr:hypothetical protein [Nitrosococcus wardiae]
MIALAGIVVRNSVVLIDFIRYAQEEGHEGMFGRLIIPVKERVHLCVPTGAVQRIGQLEFVEVVHPDGRLERRFVRTGRPCSAESVELLSGVQVGEKVMIFS